jgi:hypothetical protein
LNNIDVLTLYVLQLNSDVNAFQRKFVSEVRRCDELERKLRYIEAEVNKDRVSIPESTVSPHAPNPREIIDLEVRITFYTYSNFSDVPNTVVIVYKAVVVLL